MPKGKLKAQLILALSHYNKSIDQKLSNSARDTYKAEITDILEEAGPEIMQEFEDGEMAIVNDIIQNHIAEEDRLTFANEVRAVDMDVKYLNPQDHLELLLKNSVENLNAIIELVNDEATDWNEKDAPTQLEKALTLASTVAKSIKDPTIFEKFIKGVSVSIVDEAHIAELRNVHAAEVKYAPMHAQRDAAPPTHTRTTVGGGSTSSIYQTIPIKPEPKIYKSYGSTDSESIKTPKGHIYGNTGLPANNESQVTPQGRIYGSTGLPANNESQVTPQGRIYANSDSQPTPKGAAVYGHIPRQDATSTAHLTAAPYTRASEATGNASSTQTNPNRPETPYGEMPHQPTPEERAQKTRAIFKDITAKCQNLIPADLDLNDKQKEILKKYLTDFFARHPEATPPAGLAPIPTPRAVR